MQKILTKNLSHTPCRRDEKEYLCPKRHPCRSDKAIVWYEDNISNDIKECNYRIDREHFPLFTTSDEDISRERWEWIYEKYPRHDTECIHRAHPHVESMDECLTRDDTRDREGTEWEYERRDESSEKHEQRCVSDEFFCFFMIGFFESESQYREERVQEYRPIHHADFDELHRQCVESDDCVSICLRSHDREEYRVDFEKYDIEKEGESIGKWYAYDMADIVSIPGKPYTRMSTRIPPGESRHDEVPCDSGYEYPCESLTMRKPEHRDKCRIHHDPKCDEFPKRGRDESELCLEYCLEIAHDRTIDESEERKYSDDHDTVEWLSSIVSWEEIGNRESKYDDDQSWDSPEWEDVSGDFFSHFFIILCWDLSHGDGIESEISNHSKYREVVIELRVEAISCDIEEIGDELDHHDRDKGGEEFCSDLGKCIGVDFLSGHGWSIERTRKKKIVDLIYAHDILFLLI